MVQPRIAHQDEMLAAERLAVERSFDGPAAFRKAAQLYSGHILTQ
jgi:hypothetical protein